MKKWMWARCAVLLLLALAGAGQAEEITAADLKGVIDTSVYANLFDVRPYDAYQQGAVPGAECLPLEEMKDAIQSILDQGFNNMTLNVYVYGETEEEGRQAADILAGLGFTHVYYLSSIHAWEGELVKAGQVLGDLNTQDLSGQMVDASLIEGKKLVMVNVWATYCNPCISEMAGLGNLARELADEGVMILGLVSDCSNGDLSPKEEQVNLARQIIQITGADYPHILPSQTMMRNVISQIQAVPTTFFLNGEGVLVGQVYVGAREEADWKQIVEDTLAALQ
ncbi:MAG: redoxin domain-containing protein [Clostridia bacterium]|nr:redoxin domain-containing protein [Clostridia bacterium]